MNSLERRKDILKSLVDNNTPLKGIEIAQKYGVTRQIIVKDIAILRANGKNIIATPDGYIINREINKIRKIIAVSHNEEELIHEMRIVIKYGGIIEDVIIEHPLYGEIRAMLMIKNYNDLEKFSKKYKNQEARLLSVLTNGVHLHTISADNEENINLIINELKDNTFIVSD
ncbi:transcription repressor NadR [Clostridium weizhouense]|uniref:Transcription repressor NadR n=1 Tax=Clostridium weizhouense TaxID=2859781 RepID=A0ABS7ASH6_9CLOT|nr:transcription repressor NadR [Clostridium weizhouense]MBW6411028.1 transcription repressor NadR [Clostridium weizhouense]